MNDKALEARLYGAAGVKPGRRKLPEPDWSVVAREMKRKHVTMLWHHTMPVDGGIHINSSTPISSVNRRHPYARTANDRSPSHTMTENRKVMLVRTVLAFERSPSYPVKRGGSRD